LKEGYWKRRSGRYSIMGISLICIYTMQDPVASIALCNAPDTVPARMSGSVASAFTASGLRRRPTPWAVIE
jgi:hypothetical protein